MIKLSILIDKLIVLMLSVTSSALLRISVVSAVTGTLIAIILMSLSQCINNKKILLAIHSCYAAVCLFFPTMLIFFPVVVYDAIHANKKYINISFALFPLVALLNGINNRNIVVVIINFISVILAYKSLQNEQLTSKLIEMRDNSEENKLLLYERNRYLSKSKDDEINLAVMGERNRIAREIHDNVGHMLSRTILQMGAVRIINKDENIRTHLDEINNSLNGAMTSMRESVHNLHDDSISLERNIIEAIKTLSESFEVKLEIDASENAAKEIKLCVIGIVKEAVSNIIRHSNGDKVNILIREHPAFFQVTVEDNGVNEVTVNENGMGIENMRIRAEQYGGIFKVSSNKNGFRIFTSIPKKGFKK